jgi:hypothetical protein
MAYSDQYVLTDYWEVGYAEGDFVPASSFGGGKKIKVQSVDDQWQPWPLLADEVIRRAKRKRNEMLLLLH